MPLWLFCLPQEIRSLVQAEASLSRSGRLAHQVAHVEHLAAFCDVGQQNIHEWMLPIECRAPLIFCRNDPLDGREIAFAERVVLLAKETFPPSKRLYRVDPAIHDVPADECRHLLGLISGMHQQPIAIVRTFINDKSRQRHDKRLSLLTLG
jgi:hypothetical protein